MLTNARSFFTALFFGIVCSTASVFAQGPVAQYSFETAGAPGDDTAGNHEATQVVGVSEVAGGVLGNAGSFTNGWMQLPASADLNMLSGNFTLSLFVKSTSLTNNNFFTNVFTLAAKEGGWTKDALDHNMPLNNPFGRNRINSKGQAAGNVSFPDLKTAVADWENHIVAAPYVHGLTDPGAFVDALLAHGYNANKVPYRAAFMSIAGSMPGHMADCGVNP